MPGAKGILLLAAMFALMLWVLAQLRAVFRTLRAGRPFVADNARRIRRIAYAVIVGEIARSAATYAGMRYAITSFVVEGVGFEVQPDVNITALVCGLIILVIAEVFREGTRLAEEQSLTI